MNATDITLLIGAGSAALCSVIFAVQKSKCTVIDFWCFKCERDVSAVSPVKTSVQV